MDMGTLNIFIIIIIIIIIEVTSQENMENKGHLQISCLIIFELLNVVLLTPV